MTAGVASATAFAAGGPTVQAAKKPLASQVLDAMEGFRQKIPADVRGLFAGTGRSYKGLEPYTMPHLVQVAGGLGVGTRMECLMLLTYLKDADHKLRFIAAHAIDGATNAYPNGMSVEGFTDTGSEAHRRMLFRFLEAIEKLPA